MTGDSCDQLHTGPLGLIACPLGSWAVSPDAMMERSVLLIRIKGRCKRGLAAPGTSGAAAARQAAGIRRLPGNVHGISRPPTAATDDNATEPAPHSCY
jgi:hypothetical protein